MLLARWIFFYAQVHGIPQPWNHPKIGRFFEYVNNENILSLVMFTDVYRPGYLW
jgi:hypothetical protein